MKKAFSAFSGSATVTSDTEVVAGQPEFRGTELVFQAANTHASNALTAFKLQVKVSSSGDWITLLETTGWDTVAGILKHKVGTLKTLAAVTTGMARVDITGVWAFRFLASGTDVPLAIKGVVIE